MRGRDDAHVDLRRLTTDRRNDFVLQHAQDLGLHRARHVTDLVEKQRATVSLTERSRAVGRRAGECAFDVTEQLALQKLVRDCRTIHGDEWPVLAATVLV